MLFQGCGTAMVTPFRKDGSLDEHTLRSLVRRQIEDGINFLVPCGTSGESPTLTHKEHLRVVEITLEEAKGNVPVLAGAGGYNTAEVVELAKELKTMGADGILSVTPYYNKPTQEGLFRHYKEIHDSTGLPIILYNVPGRTGIDMSVETMARLAELPRIVGVKDATADLTRPTRMRQAIGPEFCQLSGEDPSAAAFLAQGGRGCISVTANVAPAMCAALQAAWKDGDLAKLAKVRDRLTPLNGALFVEVNPSPIKYAVSLLGHCTPELRLPLLEASPKAREAVRSAMQFAGLLN